MCATPGRLKQFVVNGEINVKSLKFLVLDEADRLLDQNFSSDINDIVNTPGFPPVCFYIDFHYYLLFINIFLEGKAPNSYVQRHI